VTREELEQAIRAACDVAKDHELYVIGSQAILGQFPDAPAVLKRSVEVDVVPKNKPEAADRIDGILGEGSRFHQTHGFYVQGLTIDAAKLPRGWQSRVIPVRGSELGRETGYCLQGYDLAASKLAAFRDKDREFVRALLTERVLDGDEIIARLRMLSLADDEIARRVQWVELTKRDV
jgi:hypothetical protein